MPDEPERNKCIADLKGDFSEFKKSKSKDVVPEIQNNKK